MNVAHGQFNAQGRSLPSEPQKYPFSMTEEDHQKLQRATAACDFIQLLLSQYPTRDGLPLAENMPGMAALMEYLRADLAEVTQHCIFQGKV